MSHCISASVCQWGVHATDEKPALVLYLQSQVRDGRTTWSSLAPINHQQNCPVWRIPSAASWGRQNEQSSWLPAGLQWPAGLVGSHHLSECHLQPRCTGLTCACFQCAGLKFFALVSEETPAPQQSSTPQTCQQLLLGCDEAPPTLVLALWMKVNQRGPYCGPLQKRCSAKHSFALHVQNVRSLRSHRCHLQVWSTKIPCVPSSGQQQGLRAASLLQHPWSFSNLHWGGCEYQFSLQ